MAKTSVIAQALYAEFFQRALRYFFAESELIVEGPAAETEPELRFETKTDGTIGLEWMGARYLLARGERPFTENQMRLMGAIGAVLSARYRSIFRAESGAATTRMFEGLPEDRFVSAFLRLKPYLSGDMAPAGADVVADALEVMRESSLLTYENRRIATGVVLLGPEQSAPAPPPDAMRYTNALVGIKTFQRLCDGLHTVFLVTHDGLLADLVDVRGFAGSIPRKLPAPSSARYHAHSLATLHGGHICLVLTPNGEIKIFAGGVQVFSFLEGRWRLSDVTEKYHEFRLAMGNAALAERLFTAALNLVEHRRGGLFVVLDDPASAQVLVAPEDLLVNDGCGVTNKGQIHYLLRHKPVLDIDLSVLQSIARVDGGLVMDRRGSLLAFGAILRHSGEALVAQEGGRTTAAMHASRFGAVLKISEDGGVSFYRNAVRVWDI
jgi:hypothetical protein